MRTRKETVGNPGPPSDPNEEARAAAARLVALFSDPISPDAVNLRNAMTQAELWDCRGDHRSCPHSSRAVADKDHNLRLARPKVLKSIRKSSEKWSKRLQNRP